MRSALILLCVALQLGVLGYMVYGRESVITGGQRIYMATAPIDPRDPFRGDFVRLQYVANNIDSAPQQWSDSEKRLEKGDVVYALLEQKPSGLHEAVLFTDTLPESGLFIRGRLKTKQIQFERNAQDVRFGIEQLFVQQGSGIAIEEKRGVRGGLQTAIEVEIAINKKGTAVLTDYRWSDLGIQIELTDSFRLRAADTNHDDQSVPDAKSPHINVSIQNVSADPVTLNNPGDNCGFRLVASDVNSHYSEAVNSCTRLDDVVPLTLESGQTHTIEINLTDPRWFVNFEQNGDVSTGDLRGFEINEILRVVYYGGRITQSDNSSTDDELQQFWRGDLLSQGFNSRRIID